MTRADPWPDQSVQVEDGVCFVDGELDLDAMARAALRASPAVPATPEGFAAGVEQQISDLLRECVAYFQRTTGHYDREQAARSYAATAATIATIFDSNRLIPTSAATDRGEAGGSVRDLLDIHKALSAAFASDYRMLSASEYEAWRGKILRAATALDRALRHPAPAVPDAAPSGTGAVRDVLAERQRQVEAEGWTAEHDDQHTGGELAQAAAAYAFYFTDADNTQPAAEVLWPLSWASAWWKPWDRRRNLVKAGALILAEIERLDRLPSAPIPHPPGGEVI